MTRKNVPRTNTFIPLSSFCCFAFAMFDFLVSAATALISGVAGVRPALVTSEVFKDHVVADDTS